VYFPGSAENIRWTVAWSFLWEAAAESCHGLKEYKCYVRAMIVIMALFFMTAGMEGDLGSHEMKEEMI